MASKGSGMAMLIIGLSLFLLGALVSLTVLGGCIGIPMVLVGIPLAIVGGFQYRKANLEELKNSIHDGVVTGMQNKEESRVGPHCGEMMPTNANFLWSAVKKANLCGAGLPTEATKLQICCQYNLATLLTQLEDDGRGSWVGELILMG